MRKGHSRDTEQEGKELVAFGIGGAGWQATASILPHKVPEDEIVGPALSGLALLALNMGAGTSISHYCSHDLEQGNAVVDFHVETFTSHRQFVGVEG